MVYAYRNVRDELIRRYISEVREERRRVDEIKREYNNRVRQRLFEHFTERGFVLMRFKTKLRIVLWEGAVLFAHVLKRILDIFIALSAIILLSPVFIVTSLAIFLTDRGNVIYSQERVGKNGRHFRFLKFRSMVRNADKMKEELSEMNESGDGVIFKMKHDPRITRVGRLIRRFSIDELPQLFNVLKGDMSIVGPRPALPDEVALYTLEERKRLHVTPGITCIWQVSGRSEIPFREQVRLDLQYISSTSIWTDIKLILKTIPAVITGKGAY